MQSRTHDALTEALECVDGMTADVRGNWPVGLLRVRHLLLLALADEDAPAAPAAPVEALPVVEE